MNKKIFKSPLDQYWGFATQIFQDKPLQGNMLDIFIGREHEFNKIMMTVRKAVIGITGTNGIGKTSFMKRIQNGMEAKEIDTIYFSPLMPETTLFKELAKTLLLYGLAKKIRLVNFSELKIIEHINRFDCRVSVEEGSEGGIDWKIFAGKLTKKTSKSYDQHTEDSAISIIAEILKSISEFCVIFIDDMETMKHTITDSDVYIRKMMYLARFLQNNFLQENICFICSLDNEFYNAIQKEENKSVDPGSLSFYFNDIIVFNNFTLPEAQQLIISRLKKAGHQKELERFISSEAFLVLYLACGGHPRKILRVLETALIEGAVNKAELINKETVVSALSLQRIKYDQIDLEILMHSLNDLETTSTNKTLQQKTGLKERQLRQRLAVLAERQILTLKEERIGQQRINFYKLLND